MNKALVIATVAFKAPKSLGPRLDLIRSTGTPLWVFDNSPGQHLGPWHSEQVFTENTNLGLGPALHHLLSEAERQGFDYLWYLDQDTVINTASIAAVNTMIEQGFEEQQVIATASAQTEPKTVLLAISSGCLFHLGRARELGFHNPDYFVEGVDYEFCLRAAIKGFGIRSFYCPGFDHEAEQPQHRKHGRWKRKYEWARTLAFEKALLRLAIQALWAGQVGLAYRFVRNMVTHAISQAWVSVQWQQ